MELRRHERWRVNGDKSLRLVFVWDFYWSTRYRGLLSGQNPLKLQQEQARKTAQTRAFLAAASSVVQQHTASADSDSRSPATVTDWTARQSQQQ
ncbi:hypothetical protein DTO063F5_975 [Paecilomyces variotii]|nr:hypothetical protein DTO063F5_975 [Paecilomyces variotii]